jgi:pilus assembly protein Flp/PilA
MLKNVAKKVQALLTKKEEGASLVEYGLLVALIAVVCIVGITALGTSINSLFNGVSTTIGNVPTGGAGS